MIEYQQPHSNKRMYIKIIAWLVICVFSWSQIAYSAGDLFYFKPAPVIADPSLQGSLSSPGLDKSGLPRQSGRGFLIP